MCVCVCVCVGGWDGFSTLWNLVVFVKSDFSSGMFAARGNYAIAYEEKHLPDIEEKYRH